MSELTLDDLMRRGAQDLSAARIDDALKDARLLMQEATKLDAAGLIAAGQDIASPMTASLFEAMIQRRLEREPVSRIIGRREFYGRTFCVTEDVLDPRADTECVVEQALSLISANEASILELGVGSGCILGTLLGERPNWTGVGVDISKAALQIAQINLNRLKLNDRVQLVLSNWYEHLEGDLAFDLIISNPPYIETAVITSLDAEVRGFDPLLALDGGADGLHAYRNIVDGADDRLNTGGALVLEIGASQSDQVTNLLLKTRNFSKVGKCKDLSGKERCVYGLKA